MKIGIDISQLAFPGTGVASYTENLVENLLKLDRGNEYVLFFSSLRAKIQNSKLKIKNDNSKFKIFKFPPLLLEFLWNRLHLVPIETFTGKLDIFHSSDWLEPPARCPKVTTIHDLAIFKYPETFVPRGGHDIVSNLKRKLEWVKKESKLIIAVSESTKKDIVEILGIPEERIRVIYEACNTEFTERAKENTEKVKRKYGIEGDYILAVGTLEPRKNLKRVIEAFSLLTGSVPVTLVIAGKFGWGTEISNDKFQMTNIKLLGYVPKEDLPALYAGAQVFVYPSLYEGFGLPILEAMACGCPVVTSNVSSMPEVAGEAAILVDPLNVEDITLGIIKALKNRKELIRKGLKRSVKFSWEKTAQETLRVYQKAYGIYKKER
ncbi:MAG: glycosyltransferase family 4 protein [Patescibacteria group bacterium]